MKIAKHICLTITICSLFTFFSCSKSNSNSNNNNNGDTTKAAFFNSFTYTVTDTLGVAHTFSDTTDFSVCFVYGYGDTTFYINGVSESMYPANIQHGPENPAAHISQPNSNLNMGNNYLKFAFYDVASQKARNFNQLTLYLPYYQYSISSSYEFADSLFGYTPIDLILNDVEYMAKSSVLAISSNPFVLDSISIKTNITDSTGGFVSGSFNIYAVTLDSKPISVTGSFVHVLDNFALPYANPLNIY
jgi:hypothetical protein